MRSAEAIGGGHWPLLVISSCFFIPYLSFAHTYLHSYISSLQARSHRQTTSFQHRCSQSTTHIHTRVTIHDRCMQIRTITLTQDRLTRPHHSHIHTHACTPSQCGVIQWPPRHVSVVSLLAICALVAFAFAGLHSRLSLHTEYRRIIRRAWRMEGLPCVPCVPCECAEEH